MFSPMEPLAPKPLGDPQALKDIVVGGGQDEAAIRGWQEEFFDEHPPLYPWPEILRKEGLKWVCKPREALWRAALEDLQMLPGERLLDIGCGTGIWLDRLGKEYAIRGCGVDVSTQSLNIAMSSSARKNNFACAEGARLPFAARSFEVVLCLDVLEHMPDQSQAIREMGRVLKEGGRLLLWTLNSKQRLTWNWCLSKLGLDIYDRVAHHPSLLPNLPEVETHLGASGMTVSKPVLFDSFFALALDEAIMIVVSLCDRIGLFKKDSWFGERLGRSFLAVVDVGSRWLLKPLMWLDRPWTKKGYSNGFMLVAHKTGYPASGWVPHMNLTSAQQQSLPARPHSISPHDGDDVASGATPVIGRAGVTR